VESLNGPNYGGHVGLVSVFKQSEPVTQLRAEKRFYPVQRSVMTEAGIDSGLTRDLFVALGEQLNNGAWSLRIYVKPFVNWIWIGAFIMAMGGFLAMSDKRYRLAKLAKKSPSKNRMAQVNQSGGENPA
jgi:cytochrome c-type biogenesis protein CcmF